MAYQDRSQRNSSAPKAVIAAQIHKVENPDKNAAFGCTATPQEIMGAAGNNFENQGGASWDAVISPFQIGGSSSKLPTMPTSASPACVVSQSNHVDPPVNEWTPPVIDISYLNPFKRNSDPVHGQGDHYDGTILFNGDKDVGQNIPNVKAAGGSFPEDIRPIALRGPLVIQGWGYDLNGKPIPNKEDDETDAQEGTFVGEDLKDEFLDDWIQKRETWPVAPVDLRYDRLRKVWTIPNTFRIIQVEVTGEAGIPAGTSNSDCTPLNISSVYKADGSEVSAPKVTVTNPSWGLSITSGQSFYAFYDTKDCTYYPIASSGTSGCDPKVTGTGAGNSIAVTVSEISGCNIYNVSGCDPKITGSGDITVTVSDSGGCKTYSVSGCDPKVTGAGDITVTVSDSGGCKTYSVSGSGQCLPTVQGTGDITVTVSDYNGCKAYLVSGCEPTLTGLGTITVENTSGCHYTISGCEPTFTGLGGLTVENTGDCNYTISGCIPTITGGSGIDVKLEGDCEYIIDADITCNTIVSTTDPCIVITPPSPGDPCPEYFVDIKSECKEVWEEPNWSLNTYAVNSGDNITFTGSTGCGGVSYNAGTQTMNIQFPRQAAITGLGNITIVQTGSCEYDNFGYTISGSGTEVTFTGAGSITTTKEGDLYTISGCTTRFQSSGGGIYLTSAVAGGCTVYTISGSTTGSSGTGVFYRDTDYCGWTATQVGCTEIACLNFGSGLKLQGDTVESPLLRVEGTYTGCGSEVVPDGAANKIIFGDNTAVTGDGGSCGVWTVKGLDQKIVGTNKACDQTDLITPADFQKLTFADNLGVQLDEGTTCDYSISGLDQKIAATGGTCGLNDILTPVDFQKLTFGRNLGAKLDNGTTCDYSISGLDQKIRSTATGCGFISGVFADFTGIEFRKNIGVTMSDCLAIVSGLDQKIAATGGTCGLNDILTPVDFQKLTFGRNLGVTKDETGECDYSISGLDQKIRSTATECGFIPGAFADFTGIEFSENIGVTMSGCLAVVSGLDQKIRSTATGCGFISGAFADFTGIEFRKNIGVTVNDCLAVVQGLDQQIEGTWFQADSPCIPHEAVPVGDFNKLIFAENIAIEKGEGCTYSISGLDQKISAAVGQCPPLDAVEPSIFTELNFAENIAVDMEGTSCKAVIKGLSQQIMASGVACLDSATIEKPASGTSNIQTWDFQENIAVFQDDVFDCKWNIKGLSQLIEGKEASCGLEDKEEGTFRKLTFADNLGVELENPLTNGGKKCQYTIKGLDQMISAGGDEGKCPSTVAKTGFNHLKFGNGISTEKVTDCEYTISKVLKGYGIDEFGQPEDLGNDNICTIKVGCGLDAELVPSNTLPGTPLTDYQIKLDPSYNPGGVTTDIPLVSDICCVGSGFEIKYRTLTFSSCGLFMSVSTEEACTPL